MADIDDDPPVYEYTVTCSWREANGTTNTEAVVLTCTNVDHVMSEMNDDARLWPDAAWGTEKHTLKPGAQVVSAVRGERID
jgi:hypothetical protein